MRATITALNPETIELQMTLSMSLAQWKQLRDQIGSGEAHGPWPLCDFVANVQAVIRHAEKHFAAEEDRRKG